MVSECYFKPCHNSYEFMTQYLHDTYDMTYRNRCFFHGTNISQSIIIDSIHDFIFTNPLKLIRTEGWGALGVIASAGAYTDNALH